MKRWILSVPVQGAKKFNKILLWAHGETLDDAKKWAIEHVQKQYSVSVDEQNIDVKLCKSRHTKKKERLNHE